MGCDTQNYTMTRQPTRLKPSTKDIGSLYEQQACTYLMSCGFKIVATNYTVPKVGEIDIIAYLAKHPLPLLIFVEVKARRQGRFGGAIGAVTYAKRQKIIRTAEHFLQHHHFDDCECRFDVMAFDGDGQEQLMQWLPSAFLAE